MRDARGLVGGMIVLGMASGCDAASSEPFDRAIPIEINAEPVQGTLPDPLTSKDEYRFTGKKGEEVAIAVYAKTLVEGGNGFDHAVIDPGAEAVRRGAPATGVARRPLAAELQ